MPVVKTTVSLTVFLPQDEVDTLQTASLSDIQHHVTHGSWIAGPLNREAPVVLSRDEIDAAMREIGNDGSFFDDVDAADLAAYAED